MGEKTCEDGGQNVSVTETNSSIDKSTTAFNVPFPPQKEGISAYQNSDSNIACMTPEKADEYLKGKLKEEGIKLQEKCQSIVELFTCLISSLRLLKMRKKLSTFHNVSCQVLIMSKRKFLHRHLAQIVYIIPEAVTIDKVMIHDKKTSCMKPKMIISLQLDIVEGHSERSDFLALQEIFASRVTKYFVMHPEKSEVPEGALPKPFNQRNIMFSHDQLSDNSSEKSQPTSVETDLSFEELCPQSSFKRHFSKKAASKVEISKPVTSSIVGSPSAPAFSLKEEDNTDNLLEGFPTQSISPQVAAKSSESPLVKPVTSASSSTMIQTPVQLTPKRSMLPLSDVKMGKTASVGSLCKPAKRFLNFSGTESDIGTFGFGGDDLQCYGIPEKKIFPDEDYQKHSPGGVITYQESSCLPELVRVIYNIFKSVNCSSITKEELVHKIIMNSLDITERREVEEQIEHLEKLVPTWISKKLTPSGDITFSISAKEDLESVVAKTARI